MKRLMFDPDKLANKLLSRRGYDPNGCWLWLGAIKERGYGVMWRGDKIEETHRIAYRVWRGPILKGQYCMHLCNNPNCFNPDHLTVGTQADNMAHAVATGRHYSYFRNKTHCKHGHKFDAENTQIINAKTGRQRRCRACTLPKAAAYQAKLRASAT